MDGLQPYVPPSRPPATTQPPPDLAQVKAVSDYVRAVRRKVWLVLTVAVPLSVAVAIWAVRQPPVYQATGQITIEPPDYDPTLSALVNQPVGKREASASERYLPNRVARLKNPALIQRVINDPSFLQGSPAPDADEVEEFIKRLSCKTLVGTSHVNVYLEGRDPALVAKQLRILLETFIADAEAESGQDNQHVADYARDNLRDLERELKLLEDKNLDMLKKSTTIGPGGKNTIQSQFETVQLSVLQKRSRLEDLQHQAFLAQVSPRANGRLQDPTVSGPYGKLQEERHRLQVKMEDYRLSVRNFNSDPAVKHLAIRLGKVCDQIDRLEAIPKEVVLDPSESITASMREDIKGLEQTAESLLGQLRASMPDDELYHQRQAERELKIKQIYETRNKIQSFDLLSKSQRAPVKLVGAVSEPTLPVRPKRGLNIAIGIALSLALGVGLVCALEHLDHSVKVPEHLAVGLTLPLLGVIPRIRRTALVHRAGHLWTPGDPGSVEADSYRNLRASLLGASDRLGPVVTLLVTSAKAGEGKSTTALNLAATCARAGERTLLMDVDLRRPSLGDVFADEGKTTGLADVLRGSLPWQRTVVRTDVPNLDFLPTGDTRDVPIEILGTLELRQLLIGLSHHYDRVILDGPAILGMADCRMLGRVVDAAVLVVRSGSHELRPLLRAKSMLEQSHVVLAGVVFNGLYEDYQNWSSYGPYTPYAGTESYPKVTRDGPALEAPDDEPASLAMAGAHGP